MGADLRNLLHRPKSLVGLSVAFVLTAILWRYAQDASFWLDEAQVALNLRSHTLLELFGPLTGGQAFPRVYLALISGFTKWIGYKTWVLRLLPLLAGILATIVWGRLIYKRSPNQWISSLICAAFILGSTFWLNYSSQLKQYSLDVALGLLPFILSDLVLEDCFARGKRLCRTPLLLLPILLSYTYPISLAGRLCGWYFVSLKRGNTRLSPRALAIALSSSVLFLSLLWVIDLQFTPITLLTGYWQDCILKSRIERDGVFGALRLILNFIWGWQAHQPRLATTLIASLQALGIWGLCIQWKNKTFAESNHWGSRSFGALFVLLLTVAISAFTHLPICCGRTTLFTQIHTQLIAIEGLIWVTQILPRGRGLMPRIALGALLGGALLNLGFSIAEYSKVIKNGPEENLRPLLPILHQYPGLPIYVHGCSIPQVDSLPEGLPDRHFILHQSSPIPVKQPILVLWSHMDPACEPELNRLKARSNSWTLLSSGAGRALALGTFVENPINATQANPH